MTFSLAELKQKANLMMSSFELYQFENRLEYNRGLNLLFEFCDYVNQMPEWKLLAELESQDNQDVINFRKMINQGADHWLGGALKTIRF